MARRIGIVGAVILIASLVVTAGPAAADLPPGTPSSVSAGAYNWNSVSVSWAAGPVGTSYDVQAYPHSTPGVPPPVSENPSAACCSTVLGGLAPSTQYDIWVYAVNSSGQKSLTPGIYSGVTTNAAGTPDPPVAASASTSASSSSATVTWALASTGSTPDRVHVFAALAGSPNNLEQAICFLSATAVDACSNNSVTIPGLTPSQSLSPPKQYSFWVVEGNANGWGTGIGTNPVTLPSGCSGSATYCVSVDATQTKGSALGRAAGLLNATTAVNQGRLSALEVTNWKVTVNETSTKPAVFDFSTYQTVLNDAPPSTAITIDLSSAWYDFTSPNNNGYATTPWSNWNAYDSWVTAYASNLTAQITTKNGWRQPSYWDIQNEPDDLGGNYYFSSADHKTVTTSTLEQLFSHAYADIQSAYASANLGSAPLLGPTLDGFSGYPGQDYQSLLDMATFLNYSDANHLIWSAISWHENKLQLDTDWTTDPEEDIGNHVATAKALLAKHLTLGSPKIVINEFGAYDRWAVPGWQAGALAVLESSGVDFAAHTCQSTKNANGPSPQGGNCFAQPSTLDGLVGTDGSSTYAIYWVGAAYGAMTYDSVRGVRASVVSSSSSSPNVGVFATREDATSTVSVLVGRNETCLGSLTAGNQDCASTAGPPSGVVDVPLTVTFPYAAPYGVHVSVNRISFPPNNLYLAAPVPVANATVTVVNGQELITLPQVADGDALTVTLSPA